MLMIFMAIFRGKNQKIKDFQINKCRNFSKNIEIPIKQSYCYKARRKGRSLMLPQCGSNSQDLHKQVEYLNNIIDNMNELFYIYDTNYKITFVNKKFWDILGYMPEEGPGKYLWEFIPERYHDNFFRETKKRLEKGVNGQYELTIIHKDGSERLVRLSTAPIFTNGQVTGEMALAEDITRRRRAEKALQQSNKNLQKVKEELLAANEQLVAIEEELRHQLIEFEKNQEQLALAHQQLEAMINFLPDPTFVIDIHGRVRQWNRAMEQLTSIKFKEIVGKGNYEYAIPFYGSRQPMLIDIVLMPRKEVQFSYPFLDIDYGGIYREKIFINTSHETLYLSAKASPLYDHHGRLTGAIQSLRDITERKESEDALKQSEEKFRNILESIQDAYFEVDVTGKFTFFNKTLYRDLGYSAHELLGNTYKIVMDKENAARVHYTFNRVYHTRCPYKEFGWYVLRKDGSKMFVETTVLPIIEGNTVIGFRGLVRDLTERKQAEEALINSENLYRTIFENTGTATIIIEEDMTISLINTEMEELSGYSREEFEGKYPWTRLIHADDQERMKSYHVLRRMNPRLAPRNYECKLINKNGEVRDVILTIAMIPNTRQSVTSLLDITDKKRAEEALQASEAHYRAIVEDQTELICRWLPNGRLTFVNQAFCRYFNSEREQLLHRKIKYVFNVPEEERQVLKQRLKSFSRHNQVVVTEHRVRRADGSVRWHQWINRAIYDEEGRLTEYQSVGQDITDRKLAEEKLTYLSMYDSLTGLYNRFYFEEEMRRLESGRSNPVTIIISDVDGLKLVNDTMGHDRGDQLLRIAARILRQSFREGDLVARVGGDEFAVILPETSREMASRALERVHKAVRHYNKTHPQLPLSISSGCAVRSDLSVSMLDVYKEADNNMYREKLHSRQSTRSVVVQTLTKALEARDFITEGHGERLQKLVVEMARSIGLPDNSINELKILAQFHDIGKVGVPDSILFKKGPLSQQEYEEMKRHSEIGHRIALSAPDLVHIADWILKHHEWWNGQGYPIGLKGEEIPLECRILALADAYDAMTSDRPYRNAMSSDDALKEIARFAGIQFDPMLASKFISLINCSNH